MVKNIRRILEGAGMKPGVLLCHPFGNANVRQAALALAEAGLLAGFRTCIDWQPGPLGAFLPRPLRRLLERRTFPSELSAKTTARPFREAGRLLASRLRWSSLTTHENGYFSTDAVLRDLDQAVAREIQTSHTTLTDVYAYEDGAEATFLAAREHGLRCHYDLPIGYWRAARKILSEEAALQPEWAATITTMTDSEPKLARKDRELSLADDIIVASRYTASTLEETPSPAATVYVIPYGCPPPQPHLAPPSKGPLRVLFVGSLGQRKGTSYLLHAIEILGPTAVTLTLLGTKPDEVCPPLDAALRSHRWIRSLHHAGVLKEMRQHDVLVFPSLFEGFGLVILEALSQGIPVITTRHTGGPDVLDDGIDGFIVPIRSAAAIAEKLEKLHRDRALLERMKSAALAKAGQLRWENYRQALIRAITLQSK